MTTTTRYYRLTEHHPYQFRVCRTEAAEGVIKTFVYTIRGKWIQAANGYVDDCIEKEITEAEALIEIL